MFKRVDAASVREDEEHVLTFEGRAISFRPGDSVAAALLAAGIADLRDSAVDGKPRAPFCMMGICFECLVQVDGKQNQQACLTQAKPGMTVRRQQGARVFG